MSLNLDGIFEADEPELDKLRAGSHNLHSDGLTYTEQVAQFSFS